MPHGRLHMRNFRSKVTGEMQVEGKEGFPRTDLTVNHRRGYGRFGSGLSAPSSKCMDLRKWTMDTDGLDWNPSSS